jgi:hypothetical protein
MSGRNKYLERLLEAKIGKTRLLEEPSKPSKPSFEGFEGAHLRPISPIEPPPTLDDGKHRLRAKIRRAIARGDRAYGIILTIDNGLKDEFIEGRFETWWQAGGEDHAENRKEESIG